MAGYVIMAVCRGPLPGIPITSDTRYTTTRAGCQIATHPPCCPAGPCLSISGRNSTARRADFQPQLPACPKPNTQQGWPAKKTPRFNLQCPMSYVRTTGSSRPPLCSRKKHKKDFHPSRPNFGIRIAHRGQGHGHGWTWTWTRAVKHRREG